MKKSRVFITKCLRSREWRRRRRRGRRRRRKVYSKLTPL